MEIFALHLDNVSIITYAVVFASGVATSFTPCIYPLIPIIVGVIGAGDERLRIKNFILSLGYVLGMAVTFSVLGMTAALTGKLFGQMQSSPIAHLIVGNVIIVFALMLLDVIPMPVFLLTKTVAGKVVKGGNIFSAVLMGLASGFIAAPCTAAVLGALLAYVAGTQNIILGSTLLFTFALGLGVLLVAIGTFIGIAKAVPHADRVMKIMQNVLALGMILLGEYFIFKAGMLSI
jgi:thiol:disulfide interchange protein